MITVAQAYIADVTDERTRTQGMGMIGAAFGLGFIVGPVMGGVLSQWGYAVPAFAAAGMALLNLGTILFLLSESLTEARKAELARQKGPQKQSLINLPAMMGKLGHTAPRAASDHPHVRLAWPGRCSWPSSRCGPRIVWR